MKDCLYGSLSLYNFHLFLDELSSPYFSELNPVELSISYKGIDASFSA